LSRPSALAGSYNTFIYKRAFGFAREQEDNQAFSQLQTQTKCVVFLTQVLNLPKQLKNTLRLHAALEAKKPGKKTMSLMD